MIVSTVVFLKHDNHQLVEEDRVELDKAYHDATFLKALTHALSPYQVVTTDDVAETLTITMANSVSIGNRSPIANHTIVDLVDGTLQLTEVFGNDRLI